MANTSPLTSRPREQQLNFRHALVEKFSTKSVANGTIIKKILKKGGGKHPKVCYYIIRKRENKLSQIKRKKEEKQMMHANDFRKMVDEFKAKENARITEAAQNCVDLVCKEMEIVATKGDNYIYITKREFENADIRNRMIDIFKENGFVIKYNACNNTIYIAW